MAGVGVFERLLAGEVDRGLVGDRRASSSDDSSNIAARLGLPTGATGAETTDVIGSENLWGGDDLRGDVGRVVRVEMLLVACRFFVGTLRGAI